MKMKLLLGTAAITAAIAFGAVLAGCDTSSNTGSSNDMHGMDMTDHTHNMDSLIGAPPAGMVMTKAVMMTRGKTIFEGICTHCHQADAKGIVDSIPPLLNSDFLMADRRRSMQIVMYGSITPITVNGKNYWNVMPAIGGADGNVASILTYVRNHFNGAADSISEDEVMKERMQM